MKKIVFLMMVLAVFAAGCKKKDESKSTALAYNDTNPIKMVFHGYHQVNATSDYDIKYTAIQDNDTCEVLTVNSTGRLYGKNVGNAFVKLNNGYETKKVGVRVDLFREPTFNFGCSTGKIKSLYGEPYYKAMMDTLLVYIYTGKDGYSYACGEMDFFFYEGRYLESDVFINKNFTDQLEQYLDEHFVFDSIMHDTLSLYHNRLDENIICGKFDTHTEYNEFCLFYFKKDLTKSDDSFLKIRPRSSKLRY